MGDSLVKCKLWAFQLILSILGLDELVDMNTYLRNKYMLVDLATF